MIRLNISIVSQGTQDPNSIRIHSALKNIVQLLPFPTYMEKTLILSLPKILIMLDFESDHETIFVWFVN